MEEQSLELELLTQLFFVFEGVSFWKLAKLPEDLKIAPMENEEPCRKVFEIGSANGLLVRAMMALSCQKINNRFRISDMLVNKVDNLYSFVIVPPFLVIIWFYCLNYPEMTSFCRTVLYAAALIYMAIKSAIYFAGKYYRQQFIKMLNELKKVPAPKSRGFFTHVNDSTDKTPPPPNRF